LAKGADKGVLLILLVGRDINLFSELIYIILFFTSFQLDCPQNDEIALPPRSPLVAPHVPYFLHCACFVVVVVVVCIVIVWQLPKATTYFLLLMFLLINLMAKTTTRHLPTHSTPSASPLQCTSHR
jgi:hypothetical protein